jgi:predicted nucleic acid-binding protein
MGFLIDTNVLSELRKKSKMDQKYGDTILVF